ncbi:MAG: leucine-rich repeat domain-containing protein, partial [Clostridia bacterium]|nr:leucine-rich repeat domain-containing protein [Clostridia bacterium]
MKNSITKKLFLALLVLCTIAVALAACSTKKAPGSGGATTDPADSPAPESSSVEKTPSLGGDSPVIIPSQGDDPIPTVSLNPECQHMTALDPAVAPTCTQNGKSEGSHCSICGGVLVAQTEIPATGHNWTEATCESPKTCSVCSETEGAAKGHDWQDATCILQKTCNTCGKAEGNTLGHDYKDGFCTRCGVGKPSEGLSYTENEDGYVVSGIGTCRDSNMVIPEEHEGKPVVAIAEGAFKDLKKINSLYVPGSVQTIGKEAFSGCTGLTKITLCEGISEIDDKAFAECEIEEIVVPKSVSRLGNGIFYKCISLTKATLGVQTIASETFNSCTGLTTVLLTEGVTTIDEYAFEFCLNLKSVSLPAGLTTIGKRAFANCEALESISLPDSVTTIGMNAFGDCAVLESCNLPAGLEILGERAFAYTCLKSVIIPSSITEMGEDVFDNCDSLEKITFEAGITKIPAGAFAGIAGLKEIVVPESVLTIEEGAFGGCTGLKAITLAEGLTTIGNGAFSGCNGLEQVVIPESVNTIGAEAFKDCKKLATVTFKNTGWTELAIGDYAFSGTALTSVVIPEGMTTISAAFSGLPSLKSVTFHDAVTAITNNAFDGCSGLTG